MEIQESKAKYYFFLPSFLTSFRPISQPVITIVGGWVFVGTCMCEYNLYVRGYTRHLQSNVQSKACILNV
jgi:hypothetical protein